MDALNFNRIGRVIYKLRFKRQPPLHQFKKILTVRSPTEDSGKVVPCAFQSRPGSAFPRFSPSLQFVLTLSSSHCTLPGPRAVPYSSSRQPSLFNFLGQVPIQPSQENEIKSPTQHDVQTFKQGEGSDRDHRLLPQLSPSTTTAVFPKFSAITRLPFPRTAPSTIAVHITSYLQPGTSRSRRTHRLVRQ